jgi:heat shock protein HtpX
MTMIKRFGFFIITNLAILLMITFVINIFGLQPYLSANGVNYTGLLIFASLFGFGGATINLFISKWMAKKMYGVQILDPQDTRYSGLVNRVHQLSKSAGLDKMPEVGIYDSPEINAFATGPSKNNSLVAVSTGLLSKMDQDETDGVLAHEVAHIANGDMVTMTLIQGVINTFVIFIARVVAQIIDNAMRDNNGRGGLGFFGYFIVVSILDAIFGILGHMIVAYFSRWREFRADAGSAHLGGKDKMIKALKALQRNYPQLAEVESGQNSKEHAAFNAMQISSKRSFLALLSTHPSLDRRIKALERI